MRILITSSYYWPEEAGTAPWVTGMAEFLSASGHDVAVVTTFPHYPSWSLRIHGAWQPSSSARASRSAVGPFSSPAASPPVSGRSTKHLFRARADRPYPSAASPTGPGVHPQPGRRSVGGHSGRDPRPPFRPSHP